MFLLTDEERWSVWLTLDKEVKLRLVHKYFNAEELEVLKSGCPSDIQLEEYLMHCDLTKKRVCEISKMSERLSISVSLSWEEKYNDKSSSLLSSKH